MKTSFLFCIFSLFCLLGFSQENVLPFAPGTKFHPSNQLPEGKKKNPYVTMNYSDTLYMKKAVGHTTQKSAKKILPAVPLLIPPAPPLTKEDSLKYKEKLNRSVEKK